MADRTRLRVFGLLNACGGIGLLAVGSSSEDEYFSFRTMFWGCVFVILAGVALLLGRVAETRSHEDSDQADAAGDR